MIGIREVCDNRNRGTKRESKRCDAVGFEDGERHYEPKPLEARKSKDTDSSWSLQEEHSLAHTLTLGLRTSRTVRGQMCVFLSH